MNEQRYIIFDHYLQGGMAAEEKNNFENQLKTDPEFAAAFQTFKTVHLQLETKFGNEKEREVFRENLIKVSDKHFYKPKVIALQPWHYSAAAVLMILVGLFFYNYNQRPSFEDFNHPESAYFTEEDDVNATLKQAETAFNSKEYKKAVFLFETILKKKKKPEIEYFYGVSLLQDNQIKKAQNVFSEIKTTTSAYKDKATWNLALIRLKQRNFQACKKILLSIPEDFEDYVEVQILLRELE